MRQQSMFMLLATVVAASAVALTAGCTGGNDQPRDSSEAASASQPASVP